MFADDRDVMRPNPHGQQFVWSKLRWVLLVLGIVCSLFAGGLYLHTPIRYQWNCPDSGQCRVTIQNEGGGFDHGFNPAYHWVIASDDASDVRFSPAAGVLQAGQSVRVQIVIAPGTCPTAITITSTHDSFSFGSFLYDPQTGRCTLAVPSGSSES